MWYGCKFFWFGEGDGDVVLAYFYLLAWISLSHPSLSIHPPPPPPPPPPLFFLQITPDASTSSGTQDNGEWELGELFGDLFDDDVVVEEPDNDDWMFDLFD